MKNNIIKTFFLFGIVSLLGYNICNAFKGNSLSTLAFNNIEALAGFEHGGQNWDDDDHWYNNVGSKWCPKLVSCTYTSSTGGSVNIGPIGGSWEGSTTTYQGQMVVCTTGSGNCVDGSNCQP